MKIKVGNKNLTIRKWKGKDKKAFINALKEKKINENDVMNSLVYSCIEEDVILSLDEFKYVLTKIREYSLGDELEIEFYCASCGTVYTKKLKISEIIKYTYKELKEIKVKDVVIKLGELKNREIYVKLIEEDPIYDLLLRVESFNGNEGFNLEELVDLFDDLDIDILSEILDIYADSKFKIDDIKAIACPECGTETLYEFDELPDFFPKSWFEAE